MDSRVRGNDSTPKRTWGLTTGGVNPGLRFFMTFLLKGIGV